ncbi:23 kDa integral membrane protein-like [Pagrus major]|uniref:23 kDa integral membrane protein-like n=1 Tax=Pagrus major TaxID=143350 RepID=UPI003CC851DA
MSWSICHSEEARPIIELSQLLVSLSLPHPNSSQVTERHCTVCCRSALSSSSRMTEVNPWLRRSFIVCNIFLPIVCGPVVFLAGLSPALDDFNGGNDFEGQTTRPIICYVVGSVAMLIAILGIYGAVKENLVALAVYLVFMIIGSLLVRRAAVPVVPVARSQLESQMEEKWRSSLPLDQASNDDKNKAEALQKSLHCCGLFSYEDWRQNIPDSCLCIQEEEEEGKCQTVDNRPRKLSISVTPAGSAPPRRVTGSPAPRSHGLSLSPKSGSPPSSLRPPSVLPPAVLR